MSKQMLIAAKSTSVRGTLARLRSDASGNVLAMAAAAIFPLAGMMGGALDLSRIYLVKTRLQAACDAGALTGRRVMGSGSWANNSNKARTQAENVFLTNFGTGSYGTGTLTKTFSEASGNVSGSASTTIPMTIMQLFGSDTYTVNVTCNSEMRISHSDVMFVLDNTGSMDDDVYGGRGTPRKIDGLKIAVKCFYEALAKINITDTTPAQCGATADPSGGNAASVQLRFGFVPYDQNVNVGKLLNNNWIADTANYQTRVPNLSTVQQWSLGTESTISWPSSLSAIESDAASKYSSWTTGLQNTAANTSAKCSALNTYVPLTTGLSSTTDTAGSTSTPLQSTTNNPPVYPAASQTLTYNESESRTVNASRYFWFKNGGATNKCWAQTATRTYNRTRTGGTSTKPIYWTPRQVVVDWTYKLASLNVSGLKTGGSTWASSVNLPLDQSATPININGTDYKTTADHNVTWEGCIEERQTFQNTDGDPSNDWSPIPTSALDMDIDAIPNAADTNTQWKPALEGATWGRAPTIDASGYWEHSIDRRGNWIYDKYGAANVTVTDPFGYDASGDPITVRLFNWSCPAAARKLAIYDDSAEATDFMNYVNTLQPGGYTYHDIGLLWGARLLSPTGLFGAENAFTPSGGAIERHIVFMTDGDTVNIPGNHTAYGIDWWDRRQTDSGSAPTQTLLQNLNNARANALCTAIKNKNINLWVVAFGSGTGISTATEDRLKACATDAAHYFRASDVPTLISNFNSIASSISQLRLTS
jgi:Flp pilus assembly protein TadG